MTPDFQAAPPQPLTDSQLSEQENIRREKLLKLMEDGASPYSITHFDVSSNSAAILSGFDRLEGNTVTIAGRMVSKRVMGKAAFAHILDSEGQLQIYVRRDDIGDEAYQTFKSFDIGDVIGVTGVVFRTQKGEISLHISGLTLLAKSLKVLPEKYHGLKDPDLRYRQRYMDMIVNPEVRETFRKRTLILKSVREFLDARGFIEVDTPVLQTIEIGAAARTFKTHLNALDLDMFLRIETELYLKRLIVGGFDKVYEVGRLFRNEGMDATHNPEFTSVETYQAFVNYATVMEMVEQLFAFVSQKVCGTTKVPYQGQEIELKAPWRRVTMADAVEEACGVRYADWKTDEDAHAALQARELHCEAGWKRGDCLAALFDEYVEAALIQPTFVTDYPVDISPLAKRKPENPDLTERFEFFINGHEMGNAFSELNDPIDQRRRFEEQVRVRQAEGIRAEVDEDYINALELGMPPTGGLGFGIDRMVMLFTDNASIRDVLLFPTMKPIK